MGNSSSATKDSLEPTTLDSLLLGKAPADWDYSLTHVIHGSISGEPIFAKVEQPTETVHTTRWTRILIFVMQSSLPPISTICPLSPDPVLEKIEPVGPQYLAHARRQLFNRSFSEDEAHLARSAAEAAAAAQLAEDAESDDSFEIEPDHKDDLRRDAKDWKTQDHYRMLGLGSIRWRATRSMIKKARKSKGTDAKAYSEWNFHY